LTARQRRILASEILRDFNRDLDLGGVKDFGADYVIDTQLPGYLNRFQYQKTDSDGSHSDSDSLRKNGKSISSDGMDDSGMGSASDSEKRKTGNSDSEAETISENQNQAGLTYEQIQQNSKAKRPKRNGSTLSRFSNIFKSDGKKLADSLTEEFYLNDRFSGLSMDRIWGGFLQQLNAQDENQVSRLDTIEEQESAGTGTEDSLRASQQQRQRRRRRRQRKHVQRADSWQKDLPADWQNVLSI